MLVLFLSLAFSLARCYYKHCVYLSSLRSLESFRTRNIIWQRYPTFPYQRNVTATYAHSCLADGKIVSSPFLSNPNALVTQWLLTGSPELCSKVCLKEFRLWLFHWKSAIRFVPRCNVHWPTTTRPVVTSRWLRDTKRLAEIPRYRIVNADSPYFIRITKARTPGEPSDSTVKG